MVDNLTIKFSSNYPKLWNQKTATLLEIRLLQRENLRKELIEYDTKNNNGEYYQLPKGTLLQLIFVGDKGIPFCTLRRHTPAKEVYYQSHIGYMFDIVIVQDAPHRKN